MGFNRKWLAGAAVAGSMMIGAGGAHAVVLTQLALVIDASGSISAASWTAQMTAYKNAILNVVPTDGTVEIGVITFGNGATFHAGAVLTGANQVGFANFVGNIAQSGGSTCISCGIQLAHTWLGTVAVDRKIIDVSTDGVWNVGVDPDGPLNQAGTAAWAVDGIGFGGGRADQVNAIGIGVTPDFAYGLGSFSLQVDDFNQDFADAIASKIAREVGVSEPGMLALMGLGLAVLGFARRKRAA